MSTSSNLDRICVAALALAVLIAALAFCAPALGYEATSGGVVLGYEERLFDTSVVHTIDIVMDDWEGFIAGCEDEEYVLCDLVIDGEEQPGAGIRAKGNTSLSSVAAYGNDRYSFKIEFDHYDSSLSYYGLDKLNLNNIIQDNTYMKDFLSYQLMAAAGAAAPLCSYVWITVNGEDWGLYLAVEGVEESFLLRNYGTDYGELYKPDSMEMGGGRGNGGGFDMDQFQERFENDEFSLPEGTDVPGEGEFSPPEGEEMPAEGGFDRGEGGFGGRGGMGGMPSDMGEPPEDMGGMPDMSEMPEMGEIPDMGEVPEMGGGMGGGMMGGSSDVLLVYTDDDYDSYANIFDNAKTDSLQRRQGQAHRRAPGPWRGRRRLRLRGHRERHQLLCRPQLRVQLRQLHRLHDPQLLPLRGRRPALHAALGLQPRLRRLHGQLGRRGTGELVD